MLAFIRKETIYAYKLDLLQCQCLEDMEKILSSHYLQEREVTIENIQLVAQVLQSRRSYKTFISDFFQEILDDLMDLIPLLHGIFSTNRSTASFAHGLFKQAQKIEMDMHNSSRLANLFL